MKDPDSDPGPVPDASLEELAQAIDPGRGAARHWARVAAGIRVEGGRAERKIAKRVQEEIISGSFDPDRAAAQILGVLPSDADEALLETRTRQLMRDLVMAPRLRGLAGAGRAARGAGRNLLAFALTQLLVLTLVALLVGIGLALLRYQGHSADEWLDRGLALVGLEPDADGPAAKSKPQ